MVQMKSIALKCILIVLFGKGGTLCNRLCVRPVSFRAYERFELCNWKPKTILKDWCEFTSIQTIRLLLFNTMTDHIPFYLNIENERQYKTCEMLIYQFERISFVFSLLSDEMFSKHQGDVRYKIYSFIHITYSKWFECFTYILLCYIFIMCTIFVWLFLTWTK